MVLPCVKPRVIPIARADRPLRKRDGREPQRHAHANRESLENPVHADLFCVPTAHRLCIAAVPIRECQVTQTKRYTRFAVPLNSIAFSEAECPDAKRLKAFHKTG